MSQVLLPHNIDAEMAVLGSMMLCEREGDQRFWPLYRGLELLSAKDFYRPAHQLIFTALARLAERKSEIDLVTVKDELKTTKKLNDAGNVEYLMAVVESVPTSANIEHYAKIVADKSIRRKLIGAALEIGDQARDEDKDVEEVQSAASQLVADVSSKTDVAINTLAEAVQGAWPRLQRYEEAARQGKQILGLRFGIPRLDWFTGGITEPGFYLIGARPSNGKTCEANDIAVVNALDAKRSLFFSLETTAEQIAERMIFRRAQVDNLQWKRQQWTSEEEYQSASERLAQASGELYELDDMVLIRSASVSLRSLVRTIQQVRAKQHIDCVLIDYLQIVKHSVRGLNRNEILGEICAELQNLAGDLRIPIIATTQLKRFERQKQSRGEKNPKVIRGVPPPTMEDLREGGNQEAAAYGIILLHNPSEVDEEASDDKRFCIFRVAKWKDGRTGDIRGWFNGGTYTFTAMEEREEYDEPNPYACEPAWERN